MAGSVLVISPVYGLRCDKENACSETEEEDRCYGRTCLHALTEEQFMYVLECHVLRQTVAFVSHKYTYFRKLDRKSVV